METLRGDMRISRNIICNKVEGVHSLTRIFGTLVVLFSLFTSPLQSVYSQKIENILLNEIGNYSIEPQNIQVDQYGNLLIIGKFGKDLVYNGVELESLPDYNPSTFIFKTDSLGELLWYKTLRGHSENFNNREECFQVDSKGNIYLIGTYTNIDIEGISLKKQPKKEGRSAFILKLHTTGKIEYLKNLNSSAKGFRFHSISINEAEKKILVTGYEWKEEYQNSTQVLMELDMNGDLVSKIPFKIDNSYTEVKSIKYTSSNEIIISGLVRKDDEEINEIDRLRESIKEGTRYGSSYPDDYFYWDCFVAKLNKSYKPVWVRRFDSFRTYSGHTIPLEVDSKDNIFFSGIFSNGFKREGESFYVKRPGSRLIKLDPMGDLLWEKKIGSDNQESQPKYGSFHITSIHTKGSNLIVAATSTGTNFHGLEFNETINFLVLEFDEYGNLNWVNELNNGSVQKTSKGYGVNSALDKVYGKIYCIGTFQESLKVGNDALNSDFSVKNGSKGYLYGFEIDKNETRKSSYLDSLIYAGNVKPSIRIKELFKEINKDLVFFRDFNNNELRIIEAIDLNEKELRKAYDHFRRHGERKKYDRKINRIIKWLNSNTNDSNSIFKLSNKKDSIIYSGHTRKYLSFLLKSYQRCLKKPHKYDSLCQRKLYSQIEHFVTIHSSTIGINQTTSLLDSQSDFFTQVDPIFTASNSKFIDYYKPVFSSQRHLSFIIDPNGKERFPTNYLLLVNTLGVKTEILKNKKVFYQPIGNFYAGDNIGVQKLKYNSSPAIGFLNDFSYVFWFDKRGLSEFHILHVDDTSFRKDKRFHFDSEKGFLFAGMPNETPLRYIKVRFKTDKNPNVSDIDLYEELKAITEKYQGFFYNMISIELDKK